MQYLSYSIYIVSYVFYVVFLYFSVFHTFIYGWVVKGYDLIFIFLLFMACICFFICYFRFIQSAITPAKTNRKLKTGDQKMTKIQIEFCKLHDWFVMTFADGVVISDTEVLDDGTVENSEIFFSDFEELLRHVGY
jgi:hypothetical protein